MHTDGLPGLDELIDYDWEGFINPGFEQLVGTHLIYNGSQYSTIHSLTENSFMCQYDEMSKFLKISFAPSKLKPLDIDNKNTDLSFVILVYTKKYVYIKFKLV